VNLTKKGVNLNIAYVDHEMIKIEAIIRVLFRSKKDLMPISRCKIPDLF